MARTRKSWRFRLDDTTTLEASAPADATRTQVRRRGRWALVVGMLLATLAVGAVMASADQVANNLDTTIDTTPEVMALNVGGPNGSVGYLLNATGGDAKTGCNLTGPGSQLVVDLNSSDTGVATLGSSSVTITACNSTPVNLSVHPVAAGSSTITATFHSVTTSSAATSSSDYDVTTATFTVNVSNPPPSDTTPPVITPNVSGTLGSNGWYVSDVTVTWTVTDPESSITSSTGCGSTTISSDTTGTTLTCAATSAGGTNSQSVTTKRDATAPSVTVALDRVPDHNGWYNHAVGYSVTSHSDATSGIAGCDSPGSYNGPDSGTASASLTCTDNAGNTGTDTAVFKYDGSGPSATLAVTAGSAGTNGWYTSDVTVSTTGSDLVSGHVTCTADQSQTTETTGQVFNGSCTNDAGLTTNAAPLTVKLDKTGPTATLAVTGGTLGTNGWYTSDVTVSTSGSDSISSPVTCTADQFQTAETTGQVFNGSCTNDAGLTTNAAPLTVKLDKTGPSATLSVTAGTLGNNGWYTGNVTVSTTGSDSISDPTTCTADQSQTTDTTGTVFNGSCTNDAGLTTNAASSTVKLDKTPPTITITTPANGASYLLNQVVNASYTCSDGTSGIDSCSGAVASGSAIDTLSIGGHSFTVDAVDKAGNTVSKTNGYSVTYKLCLLYDGTKSFKAGSTAPLKLYLCDASGADVSTSSIVVTATSLTQKDTSAAGQLEDSGSSNPGDNFRFDSTLGPSGGYIFNLSTKSPSPALGRGTTALGSGTWILSFTVNSVGGYSIHFDVK